MVLQWHANGLQGETLYPEGEALKHVIFVLRGSIMYKRWQLQVGPGGQLGALSYFGFTHFTDTSQVVALDDGVLAGLPLNRLEQLIGHHGPTTHKLLTTLGECTDLAFAFYYRLLAHGSCCRDELSSLT